MGVINRLNESAPLTDDQMSKIKYAISKNRDTLRPLQQKSVEASRALRAAVLSSAYDPANVKTLAAAAEKAEADVVSASIDAWTNIRSILTADQAAKLQELMERPQPGRGQGPSGAVPGEEGRTQPPSNGSQPSAPPTVPGQ
jgi:Spy/CpxP family protein refolding chaperone